MYVFPLQSLMLSERACVYSMLINIMETREAGKRLWFDSQNLS